MRANSPKPLEHDPKAFIATMKNSDGSEHTAFFERKGLYAKKRKKMEYGKKRKINKHNEQIRQLFGPAIPQMMGSEETMEKIRNAANETLKKRLEHYVNYYLEKG